MANCTHDPDSCQKLFCLWPACPVGDNPLPGLTACRLKKTTLCPCGYPLVKDEVKVGKRYDVKAGVTRGLDLICGGCHKILHVPCVHVWDTDNQRFGWMPCEVLEPL